MIQRETYVCISCGSITDTKNLSLTAFAITAAADWKTRRKNKNVLQLSVAFTCKNNSFEEFFFYSDYNLTLQNTVSQCCLRTF